MELSDTDSDDGAGVRLVPDHSRSKVSTWHTRVGLGVVCWDGSMI